MDVLGAIFGATVASVTLTWGLLSLAAPLLWLWMFIDSLLREEREYPGASATSNNKLLWVLLILLTQIAAIPYFFMVYSKIRRGSLPVAVAPQAPVTVA
jgi:hypothetical protein